MSASYTKPRPRIRLPRFKFALRFLLILALVWLIACVSLAGAVYTYGLTDRAESSDVIIVLGSGLNRNGQPGPSLRSRSQHAAALWHEGYAPMIICSGGFARWASRSEAAGCAEILRENGVPASAILLEERSRSTEENAMYSHEIMREHGWDSALIVSDGYHLLRASFIFSSEGYEHISTSPTTTLPRRSMLISGVFREVLALHWQVLKTALGLPVTFLPGV